MENIDKTNTYCVNSSGDLEHLMNIQVINGNDEIFIECECGKHRNYGRPGERNIYYG